MINKDIINIYYYFYKNKEIIKENSIQNKNKLFLIINAYIFLFYVSFFFINYK